LGSDSMGAAVVSPKSQRWLERGEVSKGTIKQARLIKTGREFLGKKWGVSRLVYIISSAPGISGVAGGGVGGGLAWCPRQP